MFGRAIWDKLRECIFENFVIAQVKRRKYKFSKITRLIYPQNLRNQTCDYWLITQNYKHFILKLISFNSGQLQIRERVITKQRAIAK